MLILGLLLIVVALVVFGYLFLGTRDLEPLQIDLSVFTVELTPLHLFLLGAGTLVVLVLGLLFLTLGLRASRRRRHEVKELRKAVQGTPDHGATPGGGTGGVTGDGDRRDPTRRDTPPATQPRPTGPGTGYDREVAPAPKDPDRPRPSGPESTSGDTPIALPSDYQAGGPSRGEPRG